EISGATTSSRSIINTRDEPHADAERYRRLHVIVGDSNMSEVATYLKIGTTALVLDMIEDGFFDRDYSLQSPVQAIRDISHDPTPAHVARPQGLAPRPSVPRHPARQGRLLPPGCQRPRGPNHR